MSHNYCSSCGMKVMPSIRICPTCGNRKFDALPPGSASDPTIPPNANDILIAESAKNTPPAPPSLSLGSAGIGTTTVASNNTITYAMGGRWSRFLARQFDIVLLSLIVGFAVGFVLGRYLSGFGEWLAKPGSELLLSIICLPLVLVVEALLYQVFGTTPGKALFRLRVANVQGAPLNFEQYLRRNMALWPSGLALGIPLIALLTCANQFGRLGGGLQTSYDEKLGTRVYGEQMGWFRMSVACVAVAVVLMAATMLARL